MTAPDLNRSKSAPGAYPPPRNAARKRVAGSGEGE